MPSLVSCVSLPVAMSRDHRLLSRMKTARLPSGDVDSLPPRPPPRPPRPPRSPLPPRPPPPAASPPPVHFDPTTSQVHLLPLAVNVIESPASSKSLKGSL